LHKSIGLTVLLLSFGRLFWRILNPPPALPEGMAAWERILSNAVHVLFYVFMIGTPLLGWMMVSASPTGIPTLFWGIIHWPHIAPLADMAASSKKGAHEALENAHGLAAWVILGLLALHIGGALKHQFIDKAHYLVRMLPGIFGHSAGPERKPRGAAFAIGGVFVLLALAAGLGALGGKPAAVAAAVQKQEKLPPNAWVVNSADSHITFTGKHGGNTFVGAFGQWNAQIVFDPANLPGASAKVVIETGAAKTGDTYYDSTLPQSDWFDVATTPEAVFTTKTFKSLGGDKYEAEGELSLHGVTKPLKLPFTLKIDGDKAQMDAKLTIKRLDYNIGQSSDSSAAWVANEIAVDIHVAAQKPG
jgi:polyisoprenoid-binding protein YceI/cytochrome b561